MAWTREQILAVKDYGLKEVTVEAWGGAKVWLRTMTAAERDRYFMQLRKSPDSLEPDPENFRARFLVFCICDDKGTRLFADDEAHLIGTKSPTAIMMLHREAAELNRMVGKETDEVEAARKNS